MWMIRRGILNNECAPLFLDRVEVPYRKLSRALYELPPQLKHDLKFPEWAWKKRVVLQGVARELGARLVAFRRVDCIWILIRNRELSELVMDLQSRRLRDVRFEDVDVSEGVLALARSAGIVNGGGLRQYLPEESGERVVVDEEWKRENLKVSSSYKGGLALFEVYGGVYLPHLSTYWRDFTIVPRYEQRNGELVWSGGVVKDHTMIDYARALSHVEVGRVVSELSMEELHLASVLIGLGVLDVCNGNL